VTGIVSEEDQAIRLQRCKVLVPTTFKIFEKYGLNLAENSNIGSPLVFDAFRSPESSLLRKPQILAVVSKVALVTYTMARVESIATNQSQEGENLCNEFATLREESNALKDLFPELSPLHIDTD